MVKRTKKLASEQRHGTFIVQLSTGQTARFWDSGEAHQWAESRLRGQRAGAYAAFYRAPVTGTNIPSTWAPGKRPFSVLVVEGGHGRVVMAGHANWPHELEDRF